MTRIVTILADAFADWETALLNAVGHGHYGIATAYASPGARTVTSVGGLKVVPGLALETLDPENFDALIVCGGGGWKVPAPPDLTAVAWRFREADRVLAGICDGTFALAKTGVLDDVAHTSNGIGYLDETGYGGKSHYRDTAGAVRDRRIVTAPGTAPVAFMAAVMTELGAADDRLAFYLGLHAAQHRAMTGTREASVA